MAPLAKALVLVSVLACAFAASAFREAHHRSLVEAQAAPKEAFDSWLRRFEKAYESAQEYEHRFAVWLDNLAFAHAYNQEHESHWLGLTAFADMTNDEYKTHALGYRSDLRQSTGLGSSPFSYADVEAPKSIDWRAKGAVTPVKNQAQCGSCWAFSTTGSVEGVNQIVTGELISLSEQELLDCDTERDHGCSGGLMDFAYEFIMQNGGIDTEADYKYLAEEEACNARKEGRHVVTIDGYEDVPPNDESSLQKAVAMQPVSVAIEADERPFQLYQGGIFDAPCGTALDHGVLVVGYGSEDGMDYWIVKNSWGGAWGDNGYIRLVRNTANSEGQCGIAMQASYPVKKGPNPPAPGPDPPGPSPPGPVPPGPPPPGPVDCDDTTQCPNGSTCCCMREFFGYCFTWACCPLVEATCCDDHEHCCPKDLPVCDTAAGRCLAQPGTLEGSVEWSAKTPATMVNPTGNRFMPHLPHFGGDKKQQPQMVVA